jgi:hypothetical protein
MGTAEEYRRLAWDCLRLGEGTSRPETRAAMLDLWRSYRSAISNAGWLYRAKALECMSLAESVNDPERRADWLLFGSVRAPIRERDACRVYEKIISAGIRRVPHQHVLKGVDWTWSLAGAFCNMG